MKKGLFALFFLSHLAIAEDHPYVGGSVLMDTITRWQAEGIELYTDNDVGFGIFAGLNKTVSSRFSLGFDVEYQSLQKSEILSVVSIEADGFYVNLRPRFFDTILYSELILGVGLMQAEARDLETGFKDSDSDISYQLGFEFGYHIKPISLDLGIGYRYRAVELDGIDLAFKGVMASMKYHF